MATRTIPSTTLPAPRKSDEDLERRRRDPSREVGRISTGILGLVLLLLGAGLIVALFSIWPLVEPMRTPEAVSDRVWSVLWAFDWVVSRDTALLLLVVVVSMLGSFVHVATSFATYAGNRRLYSSWVWWYVLRASIGAGLALILYFVVRGGLFSGSATSESLNPYGIAAIAGLTGLFSKQATDKLREVFDTVLSTSGDADRADKATHTAPQLDSVVPNTTPAMKMSLSVALFGHGFLAQSVVRLRRVQAAEGSREVPIVRVTDRAAHVVIPADMVSSAGDIEIVVENPEPGGGESRGVMLSVFQDAE